jgi:hypothetical protein
MVLESSQMEMLRDVLRFFAAMAASLLPFRLWARFPGSFQMVRASFASAVVFVFLGAGIGIPGFLEHAGLVVSETNAAILKAAEEQIAKGIRDDDPKAVRFDTRANALAIFTFLLLTPKGWLTTYLSGTGAVRMAAAWFDDPLGDPVLTGLDEILWRGRDRRFTRDERRARARLEGPETPDRIVTPEKADIPGCDLVIVSARRKPGWTRGVAVYTATACYRLGEPLERTIAGNLRTLYPLTEHKDFEAIRKSVTYDLPEPPH